MKSLLAFAILAFSSFAALAAPSAVLTWTAPTSNVDSSPITGAITYNVYQGVSNQASAKVDTVSTNSDTITVGLTPGTTQCFAVTAVVGGQESAKSPFACAAIVNSTPGAPSQITVVVR